MNASETGPILLAPTQAAQRCMILDSLRGFALLGIALANFPELSLYTFLPAEAAQALPASGGDTVLRQLLHILVEGKFYTIFSLLFGIGFSIILNNVTKRGGNATRLFLRRMGLLSLIGLLHLLFLWSGDILLLYALMGMLLPFCRHLSDKQLLLGACVLLLLPVAIDTARSITGLDLSAPFVALQQQLCERYGITEANFAYWLHDAHDYGSVFQFLLQGAMVRMQEFIDGNRYFKVLGLFLLGFIIGRHQLYAKLSQHLHSLRLILIWGATIGLTFSILQAWQPWGDHPGALSLRSLCYVLGVYPLAFSYVAALCLLCVRKPEQPLLRWLAAPGRMALSNYLGQSALGILIYYGIAGGLGSRVSLLNTELIAILVFTGQLIVSHFWLRYFRYGPLEWIWRMLTYGRRFPIRQP